MEESARDANVWRCGWDIFEASSRRERETPMSSRVDDVIAEKG